MRPMLDTTMQGSSSFDLEGLLTKSTKRVRCYQALSRLFCAAIRCDVMQVHHHVSGAGHTNLCTDPGTSQAVDYKEGQCKPSLRRAMTSLNSLQHNRTSVLDSVDLK